jgi:hypothetical protein
MKLTKLEKNLLIKILEDKIERFEPEDLVHMLRGPQYKYALDDLYDKCFRPTIKYGSSVLDDTKEADEKENEIIHAMWDKINNYLKEKIDFD